jgi:adenosylcobinamide-GDP ribazoletransferase
MRRSDRAGRAPFRLELADVRTFARAGRGAITFLTRVPVGGYPYSAAEWRWTSAWFPAIGALLGLAYAGVWAACAATAGALVAAVLVVVASLLLTGAFHEDGLADTADALGGAYERSRVLEILKDSRIGAFGAAALVVVLLLRVALLARLGAGAPLALVLVECLSRAPSVWLMVALPYVTGDAAAKSRLVTRASWPQALVATLWPLVLLGGAAAYGLVPWGSAFVMACAATGAGLVCGWRFHVRAGGVTGDFLGATQQVAACALLLALVLTRFGQP